MRHQQLADPVTSCAWHGLAKLFLVRKLLQNSFLQVEVFPMKLSVTLTANMFEKKMNKIFAGIHFLFFILPIIFYFALD